MNLDSGFSVIKLIFTPPTALEIRKNGRQQKITTIYVLLDDSFNVCFLLFQSLKVINKC